jgi:hypothetical protein
MLKTYNAGQVSMVFAGIPISGLADGTFVTIAPNTDSFALTIGADGEGVRAKTNNRSGRVTFTILQSSEANDLLSALHNLDAAPGTNGDGIGPLIVKDNSGRTLVTAEKAWIVKTPDAEFAREASTREWIIESDALLSFHGGN